MIRTQALARLKETAVTINQVNTALKNKGYKDELVKGKGYFYFAGPAGGASDWGQSSVYVYSINQLTLPQWVEEYEAMKAANEKG
jgi:hypothetical protein